jgi:16S rRNA (uracil1498-N3)-methyltransferase
VSESSPPRFLVPDLAADASSAALPAAEAKHARVRRLRRGAAVIVFNGRGVSHAGHVESYSRDAVRVALDERLPDLAGESPLDLTLAVAVLKADRLDWVVEKTTELGVTRIIPFRSERSLARPSAARQERWRQIAASAVKQCGRTVVPTVEPCTDFASLPSAGPTERILFWEAVDASAKLERGASLDRAFPEAAPPVMAIVGPEGGFTATEVESARASGTRIATLGIRTLRADTAAIAAVTLCQNLFGDL